MPQIKHPIPDRAAIYAGALNHSDAIIAWTPSLLDNFIMEVQGSGYVDFGNGGAPIFMAYAGRNAYKYRSIAKVLIDRGEVTRENMSLQAIRQWADNRNETQVRELLEQNPSFIFFKPAGYGPVTGASKVALIARASVAADPLLIPAGSTLLAEIPLLDSQGKFTGQHQLHLVAALDVGSAIKGQHLDIYQGIGHKAERIAGQLNHYGRVWILQAK
jgi:membrane-bound lytic murein transglycosylase A